MECGIKMLVGRNVEEKKIGVEKGESATWIGRNKGVTLKTYI
jgi:hypothetical protein